jgi:hypothetical protein
MMILASLNPNLTLDDLKRLGDLRTETLQRIADAYIKGIEACPVEYRTQVICETLGTFTSIFCQMMVW